MSNDITQHDDAPVPLWMRQKSTGASLGNLNADDMKPPEVKLLQATSPEAAEQPGAGPASSGSPAANLNLGDHIIATPIILKKTYVIWNPTKGLDSRTPMAVASDGIHWDIPNQELKVWYPNNPKPYVWQTKRTVAEWASTILAPAGRKIPSRRRPRR